MGDWEQKHDNNGSPYKEREIGYIDVPPGSNHTKNYEVAAWTNTFEIKSGVYPVIEVQSLGRTLNDLKVNFTGESININMPSLFGGVPIRGGSGKQGTEHPDVGKEVHDSPRVYAYEVKEDTKKLFGFNFTLTDNQFLQDREDKVAKRVENALRNSGIEEVKIINKEFNEKLHSGSLDKEHLDKVNSDFKKRLTKESEFVKDITKENKKYTGR